MSQAVPTLSTSAAYAALAARYRALAAEAQLKALAAIRTDPEKVQRTEATYRGLVVRQARCLRDARNIEKRIAAGSAAQ